VEGKGVCSAPAMLQPAMLLVLHHFTQTKRSRGVLIAAVACLICGAGRLVVLLLHCRPSPGTRQVDCIVR
jgi:hypothetical protein